MPKVVPSGSVEAIGRRRAVLDDRRHASRSARRAVRGSPAARRRESGDHFVAPPTSMYSMNRTSAPMDFPYSIRSHQLVVVDAPDDDRVDLEAWPNTRLAAAMPFVDARELVEARQRLEPIGVQRVEADGDAAQARGRERVDVIGEQHAVGRQREIVQARLARRASSRAPGGRGGAAVRRPSGAGGRRPAARKTSTSAEISSKCRTSSRGSQLYSSSGMQYSQRRLHRSVTDKRRLRSGRPRRSACTSSIMTDGERQAAWPGEGPEHLAQSAARRPARRAQAGQRPSGVMR